MRNVRPSESWYLHGLTLMFALAFAVSSVAQESPIRRPGATTVVPPAPSLSLFMAPAQFFRRLLASEGAEREKLLNSRPEEREQFQAFINAYEKLPPEARERRLQALELRLVITFVLRLPPESRTQVVARLPADLRPLVQSRVDYLNQFSPDLQGNAQLIRLVSHVSTGPTPPLPGGVKDTNQLRRIEAAIRQWNSLTANQRAAAEVEFQRILAARAPETGRITSPLPSEERAEMDRALERYKQLSPVQRSNCVRNFKKLAELSSAEREEFLRSAGEWSKMSPEDRQSWRDLIRRAPVPPPLPRWKPSLLPISSRLIATNESNGTND